MAENKPHRLPTPLAYMNFNTFIQNENLVPFAMAWLDLVFSWPALCTSECCWSWDPAVLLLLLGTLMAEPEPDTAHLSVAHTPARILFALSFWHYVLKTIFAPFCGV